MRKSIATVCQTNVQCHYHKLSKNNTKITYNCFVLQSCDPVDIIISPHPTMETDLEYRDTVNRQMANVVSIGTSYKGLVARRKTKTTATITTESRRSCPYEANLNDCRTGFYCCFCLLRSGAFIKITAHKTQKKEKRTTKESQRT